MCGLVSVRIVIPCFFFHFVHLARCAQLGMDLVIVHFILPVVMEHLKIRGPVRRAVCWVLMAACGATGTRRLLLHPALVAGEPDTVDTVDWLGFLVRWFHRLGFAVDFALLCALYVVVFLSEHR